MNIENKSNLHIDKNENRIRASFNSDGDLFSVDISKYKSVSQTNSDSKISSIIVSDGVILPISIPLPTIPVPYTNAHIEVYLSYNNQFVHDGCNNGDILYFFESFKDEGWTIESSSCFEFPGLGYSSSMASSMLCAKFIATDLSLDFSRKLFVFWRCRGCSVSGEVITISDTYGQFSGKSINLYSSSLCNTSNNTKSVLCLNIQPSVSDFYPKSWPSNKYIHYEVYIGDKSNVANYSGDFLEYKSSKIDPSGFHYFNGLSFVNFGKGGFYGSIGKTKIYYISEELNSKEALFVGYRSVWDGGSSSWINRQISTNEFVDVSEKTFNPSSGMNIRANTLVGRLHSHVIVGTSPSVLDYFIGGNSDDFSQIDYSSDELIEYSYSKNVGDMSKFSYYDSNGIVKNTGIYGLNGSEDNYITYLCEKNVLTNKKIYFFWRFESEIISSSSSSSFSSSSSSSSLSCSSSSCSCSSSSFSSSSSSFSSSSSNSISSSSCSSSSSSLSCSSSSCSCSSSSFSSSSSSFSSSSSNSISSSSCSSSSSSLSCSSSSCSCSSSSMSSSSSISFSCSSSSSSSCSSSSQNHLAIKFIAGGYNNGTASSTDGSSWSGIANISKYIYGICYNGSKFVGVSSNGLSLPKIIYSSDGVNWSNSSNGNSLLSAGGTSICWNGSIFVVGATTSSSNKILCSSDGINWSNSSNGNSIISSGAQVSSICWNGSKFVAGCANASSGILSYSSNGLTWTNSSNGNSVASGGVCSVCWNGSRFVAGGVGKIVYSTDGVTWINSANGSTIFASGYVWGICWNGSIFVAVSSSGTSIGYSSDGSTWYTSSNGDSILNFGGRCVCWDGTMFVAGGSGTNKLAYSYDGVTWINSSNGNSAFSGAAYSICSTHAPNLYPPI